MGRGGIFPPFQTEVGFFTSCLVEICSFQAEVIHVITLVVKSRGGIYKAGVV